MDDLNQSLKQYNDQLLVVNQALATTNDQQKRESLLTLQSDLKQLIDLTQESIETTATEAHTSEARSSEPKNEPSDLDDEYALFMQEMAKSGAYEDNESKDTVEQDKADDSDIEEELSSLLGMKCAVNHTHKWGGQPTLYNAMVSAVMPRSDDDQFKDIKVQILFTHPTHAEMLPCPFYLDGECKFSDEQCRYSHGFVVLLSDLKEAIEPDFGAIKPGTRILVKLKPPDDEDISITKKSTEKYHLWHRALVKIIDEENQSCVAKLVQNPQTGDKRKLGPEEIDVKIEDIFPLNVESDEDSDSSDSLSDTEYPDSKKIDTKTDNHALIVEKSLQINAPAMGEWERHTRGIGSKLMFAMGYVAGSGLGAAGDGRVRPVEARAVPLGKSLDHCMEISQKYANQDPLKVEQRLKRLQKKEEERNKRAYEREKEKERRNVFNFINTTLGDKQPQDEPKASQDIDVKQCTSKDLNIEQFKITEDTKRIERDIVKLNHSLIKYPSGSAGNRNINLQIAEKNKELQSLQRRERDITNEQKHRKNKQKMTVF